MGAWQVSEPWGHRIAFTQMPPDLFWTDRAGRLDWRLSQCPPLFFSKCTLGLASRSSWLWVLHRLGSDWEMWTDHQDKMRGDKVQNKTQWWYVSSHFQSVPPLALFSSEATIFLTVIPNRLKRSSLWFPSPVVLEAAGKSARFPRGSPLSLMVSFRIPRSSCCSRVRSIRGLECCRYSYHWASGSPCGQTQRAGYCCHLVEGFPCASLEFAVSSVACWGTRLPSAWTSSYLGSCTPRTAIGPPGRTRVRHTQQSVHSSTFWFSAVTTFPRAG